MSEEIYKRYKGLIDPIFSMTGMPPRGKEFLISVFATIRKNALADAKKAVAVRLAVKLTGIKMGEPFSSKMSNEIFKGIIDAIEALEVKP